MRFAANASTDASACAGARAYECARASGAATATSLARFALLILGLLVSAFWPQQALHAHEASLGVLELREVRQGAFVGRWTMEPSIGAARVDLKVPEHCFLRLPQLNCGTKGLVGRITISN